MKRLSFNIKSNNCNLQTINTRKHCHINNHPMFNKSPSKCPIHQTHSGRTDIQRFTQRASDKKNTALIITTKRRKCLYLFIWIFSSTNLKKAEANSKATRQLFSKKSESSFFEVQSFVRAASTQGKIINITAPYPHFYICIRVSVWKKTYSDEWITIQALSMLNSRIRLRNRTYLVHGGGAVLPGPSKLELFTSYRLCFSMFKGANALADLVCNIDRNYSYKRISLT